MLKCGIVFFALIMTSTSGENDDFTEYDDKLILKPAELVQLVLKERMKTIHHNTTPGNKHKIIDPAVRDMSDDFDMNSESTIEESDDDAVTLKNRKLWSRWSKWGDCSVSCGGGYIARQRACVGGLCAHGEREEQRRPCHRTPCPAQAGGPHASESEYH